MENKVKSFCSEFDFPLEVITLSGNNIDEKSLREERLNHFKKEQKKFINCHHLNDAVENYVSNTFTGKPEYVPIRWKTELDNWSEIYHPFLKTPKRFFRKYAEENGLNVYIEEDETNIDLSIRRNHIRHVIVPAMNKWSNLETIVRKKFYEKTDRI